MGMRSIPPTLGFNGMAQDCVARATGLGKDNAIAREQKNDRDSNMAFSATYPDTFFLADGAGG
jgi:hypothetical protein